MTADLEGLPASPTDEDQTSRVIAAGLRADAERLRIEIQALTSARWLAITHAAAIERELRGI
jgi:hypothetical protein